MTRRILVVWPGGPHNFVLQDVVVSERLMDCRATGWRDIEGTVVEPAALQNYRRRQSFYVRRANYGYELMPANRDPIAIWEATGWK